MLPCVKKYPNANVRQSQGIRLSHKLKSKLQNEQLPTSTFQRDTIQTIQHKRKHKVTGLSNVIVHKLKCFIYTGSKFHKTHGVPYRTITKKYVTCPVSHVPIVFRSGATSEWLIWIFCVNQSEFSILIMVDLHLLCKSNTILCYSV